jgi:hypothetical protein
MLLVWTVINRRIVKIQGKCNYFNLELNTHLLQHIVAMFSGYRSIVCHISLENFPCVKDIYTKNSQVCSAWRNKHYALIYLLQKHRIFRDTARSRTSRETLELMVVNSS